jgi:CDP-diacylglycerol--serine O-phosphatidyltransferase
MIKHFPNFITLLNLISGCIAITFAFQGNLAVASWLIALAAVFDFLDGMAARLLNVKSAIGKELDSLADVVSFGVVPGVIIFQLLYQHSTFGLPIIPYIAFLIPAFSALRLAKFNLDTRQEEVFYGLPTPATALLIASFPLILEQNQLLFDIGIDLFKNILINPYFLIAFTLLMSWLLIAEIPLLSLKFKNYSWLQNKSRYILILMAILLLILFQFIAIPLIILVYIIISLLQTNS